VLVAAALAVASSRLVPAEWDPRHDHIVVGGSLADRVHALAAHFRERQPGVAGAASAGREASHACHRVRVVAIHKSTSASSAVLGVGVAAASAVTAASLYPVGGGAPLAASSRVTYASITLDVPPPPPRSV
jgi:hypothetical protein